MCSTIVGLFACFVLAGVLSKGNDALLCCCVDVTMLTQSLSPLSSRSLSLEDNFRKMTVNTQLCIIYLLCHLFCVLYLSSQSVLKSNFIENCVCCSPQVVTNVNTNFMHVHTYAYT